LHQVGRYYSARWTFRRHGWKQWKKRLDLIRNTSIELFGDKSTSSHLMAQCFPRQQFRSMASKRSCEKQELTSGLPPPNRIPLACWRLAGRDKCSSCSSSNSSGGAGLSDCYRDRRPYLQFLSLCTQF
uniref:PH domain-containing protein n=1 Tax=Haemonchus placei TaxID=6290 RepID=A0A0N4WV82_HAEPC